MTAEIKRGGPRPGAGRKPGPPTKALRFWLEEADHEAALHAGGPQWVKSLVLKALKARKAPTPSTRQENA